MNIGIDSQAFQAEVSRNRGIGRYSYELVKAILKNNNSHDININLSGLYEETLSDIINELSGFSNVATIVCKNLLDMKSLGPDERNVMYNINSYILKKQFTKQKLDILLIQSLFEGYDGNAVVPNQLSTLTNITKSAILYDLIPLIYKDIYLNNQSVKEWYFKRLHLLYEMDLVLAISESARQDAIEYLGLLPEKVVNISGAVGNNFYKIENIDDQVKYQLFNKYNINKKYILYTGGIDFRKNIEASIEAFSKIDTSLLNEYQFVIVCTITDDVKNKMEYFIKKLGLEKSKVVFTGYIPDIDLNLLYNLCDLFIFPSLYEGFGLPVLEAMKCGAAVIASNSSSIPEIVGECDCLFNPKNIDDISKKINNFLTDSSLRKTTKEYLYQRSKDFTWDNSANKALAAFEDSKNKVHSPKNIFYFSEFRKKIAFFSPLPKIKSGISDYSESLIPFLANYFDIDLYIDDYEVESDILCANYSIYNYRSFETNKDKYDLILYHFGNSPFHYYMYDMLEKYPGIVVLHDFFLGEFINYISQQRGGKEFFYQTLRYSLGAKSDDYIKNLQKDFEIPSQIFSELPLNKAIIDNSLGIIVHSNYAKELFHQFYPQLQKKVSIVKIFAKTAPESSLENKIQLKKELGFESDSIIICAFGHIVPTKQYDFIINCFNNIDVLNNINIVFAGELPQGAYADSLQHLIRKSPIKDKFRITGYIDDLLYKKYLEITDIAISLRFNSRGESSAALIKNLAYGIPTLVNSYGSFDEFPDNVAIKIRPNCQDDFVTKILQLIRDKNIRTQIAQNARQYIYENHRIDLITQEYSLAILQILDESKKNNIDYQIKEIAHIIGDYRISNLNLKKISQHLKECINTDVIEK